MIKIKRKFFFGKYFFLFRNQFYKFIAVPSINMRIIYGKVSLQLHAYAAKAAQLAGKSCTVSQQKLHAWPAAVTCLPGRRLHAEETKDRILMMKINNYLS
jgi:hypothetical protein